MFSVPGSRWGGVTWQFMIGPRKRHSKGPSVLLRVFFVLFASLGEQLLGTSPDRRHGYEAFPSVPFEAVLKGNHGHQEGTVGTKKGTYRGFPFWCPWFPRNCNKWESLQCSIERDSPGERAQRCQLKQCAGRAAMPMPFSDSRLFLMVLILSKRLS